MTSERLGRLREWVKVAAGSEVAFVYSDGILRLLDEREALLGACRVADDALSDASEGGRFYAAAIARVQAALAKAESP